MNQTPNYQLNQWEATDRVKREDFNGDNAKIDAALAGKGNCQVITGSYAGTGTVGEKNPNVLTLPQKPLLVIVWAQSPVLMLYGAGYGWLPTGWDNIGLRLTWSGTTLSWYNAGSSASASNQLNVEGTTYRYLALIEL